jgi:hypothetical protein
MALQSAATHDRDAGEGTLMKTVTNKTRAPIRIRLPGGKALYLGPFKTGQIRDQDASHPALKKLVEAGEIEIFDGRHQGGAGALGGTAPHEATHGFSKAVRQRKGGDRSS